METAVAPSASVSASPGAALPPTSEELIAAALASGKIDFETSLAYRAYAVYGDPRLPAEYRSPVIQIEALRSLANDVHDKEATLSSATLGAVEPFLARPNDPVSIFSTAPPTALTAAGFAGGAVAARITWLGQAAAGGKVRVWVRDSSDADVKLGGYTEVVTQVWAKLEKFLRLPRPDSAGLPDASVNPNNAIDVYFVGLDTVDPRRQACQASGVPTECTLSGLEDALGAALPTAPWDPGPGSSGFALVQDGISGSMLWATVAHELFHVAQFSYDRGESDWLMEATASWGEFRILDDLGIDPGLAHSRLPSFFDELHVPLTSTSGAHEYGAWLYFLYAQMAKGDGVVRSIWENAAAPGAQSELAVGAVLPFVDNFPKFALRNYNNDPVDPRYSAADKTFPGVHPRLDLESHIVTADNATVSLEPTVNPLAARYVTFAFGDDSQRSIVFHNTYVGNHDAAVQAVVSVDDKWHIEDWTGRPEVTFCRDIPSQDVQEIVVIMSNAHPTEPLAPSSLPRLEAKQDPCTNWAGTVTMTYTNNVSFPGIMEQKIELNLSGNVSWTPDPLGTGGIHDLEGSTLYLPADGSITWEEHGQITTPSGSCTISGGGTYPIRDPEHYRFYAKLEVATDSQTGVSQYIGHGLEPPETALGDIKVTCNPSGLILPPIEEDLAGSWLTTGNSADNDGGVKISDEAGSLSGTYISDSSNQGTGIHTWTWNFQPAP